MFQISKSNEKQVTLNEVPRQLTGYYKCEVSADAPSFHTDIKSALVIVIGEYGENGVQLFESKRPRFLENQKKVLFIADAEQ